VRVPEPRRLGALIFDFDHTLADLGRWVDWRSARQEIERLFARLGIDAAALARRRGDLTPMAALEAVLADHCSPAEAAAARAEIHRILEGVECAGAPATSLLVGAAETLACARRAGLALAIVSANAETAIHAVLERLGLADDFGAVVGRGAGLPMKPAPDMYAEAARRIATDPAAALAVGDSPSDVAGAVAAGIEAIGVLGGEGSEERLFGAGASWVLADLRALPPLLAFWASHVSD